MADDMARTGGVGPRSDPEAYEPPQIELLGTVAALTQGPDVGSGDVDAGVISF